MAALDILATMLGLPDLDCKKQIARWQERARRKVTIGQAYKFFTIPAILLSLSSVEYYYLYLTFFFWAGECISKENTGMQCFILFF